MSEILEPLNVIIKKDQKEGNLMAFDCDTRCNKGNVWSIDKTGSCEASYEFYRETIVPSKEEVAEFKAYLEKAYDCVINVRRKFSNKDLSYIWSDVS